jgi:hypothetical protein
MGRKQNSFYTLKTGTIADQINSLKQLWWGFGFMLKCNRLAIENIRVSKKIPKAPNQV